MQLNKVTKICVTCYAIGVAGIQLRQQMSVFACICGSFLLTSDKRRCTQYAVLLFSSLTETWVEHDGYTIGTDLRFWSKASKFAMELLSKQYFVPALIASDTKKGENFARWQHVLSEDEERTHMSMLSRSMPPVCASFIENTPTSDGALLSDYLNAAIDNISDIVSLT